MYYRPINYQSPQSAACRRFDPKRGSVILTVVICIVVLTLVGGSFLRFSSTSHALAMRNTKALEAQKIAESELEMMYYNWYGLMIRSTLPEDTVAAMTKTSLGNRAADPLVSAAIPYNSAVTTHTPFNVSAQTGQWQVRRSFGYNTTLSGQLPGNNKRIGTFNYYTACVIVTGIGKNNAGIEARVGRRFQASSESIFQYAVFYQGDLELAPGSNMDIHGPVSSNGSIYAGSNNNQTLTFYDQIRFAGSFNGDSVGVRDIDQRIPKTSTPEQVNPNVAFRDLLPPKFYYAPDGVALSQYEARTALVKQMQVDEIQNFLGGADASQVLAESPDLFNSDVNNVYHAIIDPPPSNGADNATIAPLRLYNNAGLRITITTIGDVQAIGADGHDYTGALSSVIPSSVVRTNVYDQREKKIVKVTSVDIGNLRDAINNNAALKETFNGLLYINDQTTSDGVIRLVNAAQLPDSSPGFTIATANALYIQGDYNTPPSGGTKVPSAIVADTVTALSAGWKDALSTSAPQGLDVRKASGNLTITAGILTGNTATTPTNNSGGAQNLVRLMEDWSGKTITMTGSVGQLFNSKYFKAPFPQTMTPVYWIPSRRIMNFDNTLAKNPPPGSIPLTKFSRGDLIPSA